MKREKHDMQQGMKKINNIEKISSEKGGNCTSWWVERSSTNKFE